MRNRIIAMASFVVLLSVGCSSGGDSTTTPDTEVSESPAEQTTPETDMSDNTDASDGDAEDNSSDTNPDDTNSEGDNTENVVAAPVNPLEGLGTVQRVGTDFGFLEGPVYSPGDGSVYFSDIPENTIFRLLADGSIETFRKNQQTNGLIFDAQNRLIIATHGGRALGRLEASGDVTVLADRFEGALLNSPNDIALHSNGDVYFTDPPYGINPTASETGCAGVYRLMADGSLSRVWCNGIETRPNGIALSPNQDRLYVAFTASGQILSWPMAADGSAGDVETFASTAGNADGMVIDANGNLFVTSSAGVEVFAPDGTLWGSISIPEQATNCTLGGPNGNTLYVTGKTSLYTVELQ